MNSQLEYGSSPFKGFYELIGGSLPDSSSVLVTGDPGSGKTTLAQQILYEELQRSRPCIIVTYDTFPANILERMGQFGWDPRKYQLLNKLSIVDCYSATAGVTEGVVPQPFDLTNVSIYLTSVMEKMGNHQVTIIVFHKVESLVDGVVELRMVEEHQVLRRYLLVRKMDRRQIIPRLVRFDIISGIGIQLHLPRFGFLRNRPSVGRSVGRT